MVTAVMTAATLRRVMFWQLTIDANNPAMLGDDTRKATSA
jgi:hypothetical protein